MYKERAIDEEGKESRFFLAMRRSDNNDLPYKLGDSSEYINEKGNNDLPNKFGDSLEYINEKENNDVTNKFGDSSLHTNKKKRICSCC